MLKKLKMTTFAVVLCLFGFVLVPAAPAWAGLSNNVEEHKSCAQIAKGKWKKKAKCFKRITANMHNTQVKYCRKLVPRVGDERAQHLAVMCDW